MTTLLVPVDGSKCSMRAVDHAVRQAQNSALTLHLLAPNNRPQQITDDLGGFWERTYPQVRKELAGRYPKHAWPEDPWNASSQRRPGRPRP